LDLEDGDGREKFRELAANADVVIEDKPYGYLDQLRIGYADLQQLNPALVLTSISGFGRTGPYREFKAPSISPSPWAD
jgi:crotonobetainyl-CoA:carnitine CoA-transferase CaiB-like acyl-CoA transferase